jgi:capsular exopolysaccharide synthesis family protein
VDLAFVLTTLRRAWWLLLLTAVLGTGGAAVVNETSPVQYQATVQLFVSISGTDSSTSNILSGSQFTLQRVKSYTQVATSSQVLDPVIDQLDLPTTTSGLAGQIEATNPLDTVLIEVAVTDGDPRRAADIANAVSVQLGRVVEDIETTSQDATPPVKVTVTEPAVPPTVPVSPRTTLNLALGLLVGLSLGVGAALLRAQLDTRVKHARDLRELAGAPQLGAVPFDPQAKSQPLITADQSTPRAEAFRSLRTNLQFIDVDNPPRTIVVTSPLADEGKTTTACNIALTLALAGSRVALVEGDLRKPRACAYLGLDSAAGLTNVLAGQHPLAEVLVHDHTAGMAVLPAGPPPPNPSELLGSGQMLSLLATLNAMYDYVIVDAAPLLPVTDAAVVGSHADGVLLLVRHNRSTRDEVERAAQTLAAAKARVLGTVFTFVPRIHKRRRPGYGYGYGYGYGPAPAPATRRRDTRRGRRGGPQAAPAPSAGPAPEPGPVPVSPAGAASVEAPRVLTLPEERPWTFSPAASPDPRPDQTGQPSRADPRQAYPRRTSPRRAGPPGPMGPANPAGPASPTGRAVPPPPAGWDGSRPR